MAPRKKVREGEEFYFCNGESAKTVAECRKHVEKLSPEEFAFHVNDTKNDVYNWIRDCINPAYAESIKDLQDQAALVQALKQTT